MHPVHVESVAWISGSPDLLFAAFLLGSLLLAVMSKGRKIYLGLSLLLYGLSLGAKEVAVLCIPLFAFVLARDKDKEKSKGFVLRDMFGVVAFATVAFAYLLTRFLVLGSVAQTAEDSASVFSSLLSAPIIFLFYLGQVFFPLWLGPNYGVRPVESIEFIQFVVPLLTVVALFAAGWLVVRLSRIRMFAIAMFILPLIPVFNVTAFPSEQIVHDRYLYLSLLGMLTFLFLLVPSTNRAPKFVLAATLALAFLLGFQTLRYSSVWKSDLSLWRHSVTIDQSSSFNWLQLGSVLTEKELIDEAIDAHNKSLAIRPSALALVGRARNQITKRESNAAITDLKEVLNLPPESINAYTLFQAYEAYVVAQQSVNRLADAEVSLREARIRLPIYRAALTEKLAVVLYLQNKKPEALTELESVRDQARVEMLTSSKFVFLRLGMLNAEIGKVTEAKRDLSEFLERTKLSSDPNILSDRKQALALIERLGR
ncbi:MAG: tetratricopeptide repeat protein [Blastocatellia bacterium]